MNINEIVARDMVDDERRETEETMLAKYDRDMRRRRWEAVGEAAAFVVFVAIVGVFCWLCMAGSGYNWQ